MPTGSRFNRFASIIIAFFGNSEQKYDKWLKLASRSSLFIVLAKDVYTAGKLLPLIFLYRSRANTSVMPEM